MKTLATFLLLFFPIALFPAKESKVEEVLVPVEQLISIDQTTYERSDADNIMDGHLMCGLFAAYNGELMINRLHSRRGRVNSRFMIKPAQFNNWMMINGTTINALQRRGVGNIPGNVIEQLLPQEDFYRENCTVIELATLHDSFLLIEDRQTFLPADNRILEVIQVVRTTKLPHLVILNSGSHWISIVITQEQCFVADSLNLDRTTDKAVQMLHHLFTKQVILPQAQIEILRATHRDHHAGGVVDDSLGEMSIAAKGTSKKGKGKGKGQVRTKRRATADAEGSSEEKIRGKVGSRKLQRVAEGKNYNIKVVGSPPIQPVHIPASMLKTYVIGLLLAHDERAFDFITPLVLMAEGNYTLARKIIYKQSLTKDENELILRSFKNRIILFQAVTSKKYTSTMYKKVVAVIERLPVKDEIMLTYESINRSVQVRKQLQKIVRKNLHHIAIIPDGDRRWARARGLHESEGHKRAFTELSPLLIEDLLNIGVNTITLWGTSPYTLKRSQEELANLMIYFAIFIQRIFPIAHQYQVKIVRLGSKKEIPFFIFTALEKAEKETQDYTCHTLNFAINYGGNDEIIRACKRLITSHHDITDIDEEVFTKFLDTANQPYPFPDLIIRASGEQRLSGFMAFQIPFSEWYFDDTLFPDFTVQNLQKAILYFGQRKRRFGK